MLDFQDSEGRGQGEESPVTFSAKPSSQVLQGYSTTTLDMALGKQTIGEEGLTLQGRPDFHSIFLLPTVGCGILVSLGCAIVWSPRSSHSGLKDSTQTLGAWGHSLVHSMLAEHA